MQWQITKKRIDELREAPYNPREMDKDEFEKLRKSIAYLRVLDLFSGCGGLALGFSESGNRVIGVDINPWACETYRSNGVGEPIRADLRVRKIEGKYDVILGGPPCRPWSSLNLRRRKEEHPDFYLITSFFEHVVRLKPVIFIFENVPPIKKDLPGFLQLFREIEDLYNSGTRVIRYSDFGAPVKRKRLFLAGIRRDTGLTADEFWHLVDKYRREPKTVRKAIGDLPEDDPEHIYPRLRTIRRYRNLYETGKFGWYILKWDEPAPSFGNVMKTYILHPDSSNGSEPRVISVREALSIMGFPRTFRFPESTPISGRYQMIADSVSPVFSRVLAEVTREVLDGGNFRS